MKLITNSMLRDACRNQRVLFRRAFPDGAPVTIAAAQKARKAGLKVGWLSGLLSSSQKDEYIKKCNLLYDEYGIKCGLLDDQRRTKRRPFNDEYWKKLDSLYDTYEMKRDAVLITYLRKVGEAKE